MADHRPPVYFDEVEGQRALIIRASALGHPCLWELVAAGQGHQMQPVPDKLQIAFDESADWEEYVIEGIKSARGAVSIGREQEEGVLWCGEIVREQEAIWDEKRQEWGFEIAPVSGPSNSSTNISVYVRFHPEFPCGLDGEETLVEVKAFSKVLFDRAVSHGVGKVFDEYRWQLAVMSYGMQLKPLWAFVNKEWDKNSTDWWDDIRYEIPTNLPTLRDIMARGMEIALRVLGEDVVQSHKPCDAPETWPCRFLHLRPEPENYEIVADDDEELFNSLVEEYAYAQREEKGNKKLKETTLGSYIERFGRDKKLVSSQYVVTRVDGSNSYLDRDTMFKWIKDHGGDPEQFRKQGKSYNWLIVKEK